MYDTHTDAGEEACRAALAASFDSALKLKATLDWIVTLWVVLMAAGAAAVGAAALAGGPERMTGPSYAIVTQLAPWWAWGCAFIASGAALALAAWLRRLIVLSALLPAFMHGILAAAVFTATQSNPTAGMTGVAVYSGMLILTLGSALVARDVLK